MDNNGKDVMPQQPQPQQLDPHIQAIFEDIESKLNQVSMMLVLQFSSNIALNCISQLPGMKKEVMALVTAPIVAAYNAALQYSEATKRSEIAPDGTLNVPEGGETGATATRTFNS